MSPDGRCGIVIFTGSRVLADDPASEAWVLDQTDRFLATRPDFGLWTGDARSDDLAIDVAFARQRSVACWLLTGWIWAKVYTGEVRWRDVPKRRWTEHPAPQGRSEGAKAEWKARCLARDRAIVTAAVKRGGTVEGLALISRESKTHGTAYTADRMAHKGIAVKRCVFEDRTSWIV